MAPSNMLKFFGGVSAPQDQVTPKASSQSQMDPFDLLPNSVVALAPLAAQRSASIASLAALLPSGARTPTHKRDSTSASTSTAVGVHASPGVMASLGGGAQQQQQSFFGRDSGPGDVTPGGPATLGAAPFTPGGVPTTGEFSLHHPFARQFPPAHHDTDHRKINEEATIDLVIPEKRTRRYENEPFLLFASEAPFR
ncbi:BQ2448_4568 [Microbotryum intermedium]|uniref:BQ2448_4568 protein n=1 Tax=Microbotryum intermedium TaxID=269621 RepID=A0A238FJ11_9BASI|nr:BQ2448_4568 [Microbotryum intermedium]